MDKIKRSFSTLCFFLLFISAPLFSAAENNKKFSFCYSKYIGTDENLGISGLKFEFLEQLYRYFQSDAFIESGTYLGDTSYTASLLFPNVFTIELAESLYRKACQRFQNQSNVHLYWGDSAEILPLILPNLTDKKVLFFLDGHYSKRMTAKGDINTPILLELEAVKASGITNSVIIVDDIRLFQDDSAHQPKDAAIDGYPSVNTIFSVMKEINPDYVCAIIGDMAIAYPQEEEIQLSEVVKACTKSRIHYENDDGFESITIDEQTIANAEGEELECIKNLYDFFSAGELKYGLRSFSSLWFGLTLMKDNPSEAHKILSRARNNSPSDWQINSYTNGL